MKRKYLLLAAAFLLPWLASASPVKINSSGNNIQDSFTLGQWQFGTETVATSATQNTTFQTIEMLTDAEEYGIWADEGYPELPQLTVHLLVPQTATACQVTVVPGTTSQYTLPRKILPYYNGSDDEDLVVVPNAAYYSGNEAPLTANYEVSEIYEVMGQKAVSLTIYPFTYIPAQNRLNELNTATFTLKFDVTSSVPQTVEATEARVSYLSSYFTNYNAPKGDIKKGNYLIITPQEFKKTLSVFAAYKNTLGYNTSIVTTEETGKTAKAINDYIDNLPSSQKPTFILLAGDVNKIPANEGIHYATSDEDPLTDQAYRKHTAGKRSYGEYFVGRWPISVDSQAVSIVNRTISMEKAYATVTPQAVKIKGTGAKNLNKNVNKGFEFIQKGLDDRDYDVLSSTAIQTEKIQLIIYAGHGADGLWKTSGVTGGGGYYPIYFTTNIFSPILWGFACSTGFYGEGLSKDSRFPTSIVCNNAPIAYFGASLETKTHLLRFTMKGMNEGLKKEKQLGPVIHSGMTAFRKYCHSKNYPKKSDIVMQAYNLMGDPSFVMQGISINPAHIVLDKEYHLVNGISADFEAIETIEISGAFAVEKGASLNLRAGEKVVLGSGFKIEEGGTLCVTVE